MFDINAKSLAADLDTDWTSLCRNMWRNPTLTRGQGCGWGNQIQDHLHLPPSDVGIVSRYRETNITLSNRLRYDSFAFNPLL